MTILSGDIKLLASQRLTDTPDGGGRVTGHEIVSGEHNSLFPDVSDLDRAYGVVNLRKAFLAVQTDDTDTYYGANTTVLLPPSDPSVGLCLMSTGDHHDTRAEARDVLPAGFIPTQQASLLVEYEAEDDAGIHERVATGTAVLDGLSGLAAAPELTDDPRRRAQMWVMYHSPPISTKQA